MDSRRELKNLIIAAMEQAVANVFHLRSKTTTNLCKYSVACDENCYFASQGDENCRR